MSKNPWLNNAKKTITSTKHLLSNLSVKVRTDQFSIMNKLLKTNKDDEVLDVGVTSDESLKDSNLFEKIYPHKSRLTLATIENKSALAKLYPNVKKIIKITPHTKLPFKNNQFDLVVSWATLEHVGNYTDQEFFINELLRVGKKVFITTPYRGCIYEPHSGLLLIHWLPLSIFRMFCKLTNRHFWSTPKNLNPLYVDDISTMRLTRRVNINVYKMFKFVPSHLIIYSN